MLLLVVCLLFCSALSQEICTSTGVGVQGGVDTIDKMVPQKVIYVNIIGPYYYEAMKTGWRMLDYVIRTKYPASRADYFECTTSFCSANWDQYTQIWVADLSSWPDDSPAQRQGYNEMANWYVKKERPHMIADGRLLSSLWPTPTSSTDPATYAFSYPAGGSYGTGRPNPRLIEDYFVTLALRGGGMMLGTDHEPFLPGINSVLTGCGFNPFYGVYYTEPLVVVLDVESVCVSYPMDASEAVWNDIYGRYGYLRNTGHKYLWDDSSTAFAPISQQPNSLILYPIAWHGTTEQDATRPAISTTVRGSSGFLIDITAPACGLVTAHGPLVAFRSIVSAGGVPPIRWEWSSSKDGVFGNVQNVDASLTPGVHIVTIKATDSQRFVAKAWVTITLFVNSGKAECFIFSRNNTEVVEYFPITTTNQISAVNYYSYGSPLKNRANTLDHLEDRVPLSSNVALYSDGKEISVIWVQSQNPLPAKVSLTLTMTQDRKVDGRLDPVTVTLRDDPTDVGLKWQPSTLTGTVDWTFQSTTKGFILGHLPDQFMDRWCINVHINAVTGINFADIYGYPSPDSTTVQLSQYGIAKTADVTFCRTSCNCPGTEARTNFWGFIEPIRWSAGNPGNFFSTYNDQFSCTWTITPQGEATPVEGITFHWDGTFAIAAGDSISMYGFSTGAAVAFANQVSGTTPPAAQLVKGQRMDVAFNTNHDGKADAGWLLHYMAMPSIFSISPSIGASTDTTTAIITGAYIVNSSAMGARLRKPDGTFLNLAVTYISSTKISVVIPPGPVSTTIVEITNDNHVGHDFWTDKKTVTWEWFDASCSQIKTCAGCAAKFASSKCTWCNDLKNPANSFCYPESTGKCPVDASHKIDTGCCSQCQKLSVVGTPAGICHGGGKCNCDDTCTCDNSHWANDCHCNRCPAGVDKPANAPFYYNCSGRGTCNCDGSCTCDRGFESRAMKACECKVCEGVPTICSGHGTCECDGTCTCEPGWKHAPGGPPTCSCKAECPNNCSGHGRCECGVCVCDPGFAEQPDCSCADSCDNCTSFQVCACDGTCQCPPGYHGDKCDEQYDCGSKKDCLSCMDTPDCGWCGDANVCENIYNLLACAPNDELLNPRGFTLAETCPVAAIDTKDVESDNKSSILVAAIVGSLSVMALFMLLAAYFWRAVPFETVAHGFEAINGDGFNNSAIYESGGVSTDNAIYQG